VNKQQSCLLMEYMMPTEIILELKNISKIYPGVKALDDVSIKFNKGEVHAIVGENGAGKSTLIKILTGAILPNEGKIIYCGKEYDHFKPVQAIHLGISAIYQEFNLVPYLSVAENIFYGREIMNGPFVNITEMNRLTRQYCEEMGVNINPKSLVKELGVAQQQIVEIIKSISQEVKILIMDEPTAPLTKTEIEAMFEMVKKLKKNGVTIIYISHRLEELYEICDSVSIMRDGKYITTQNVSEITRKEIISFMVGRELGESFPEKVYKSDEVVLEIKNLSNIKLKDISLTLKKGEILGIGGLVGSGRTSFARAVFGAYGINNGEILLNGKKVMLKSPAEAIGKKIGLLPEDRKQQGLLLGLSIKENISYGILDRISNRSFINSRKEKSICTGLINELHIKTPGYMQIARNLSGGNQQKVVIAKWLASECEILIFDEPTRGIDVGAKHEIYILLKNLAESGKSIIMISSEMPELIGMSDRIIVMHEGRITGILEKDEFSQEKILELACRNEGVS
jgi:ribose transport system ATP-binding protein